MTKTVFLSHASRDKGVVDVFTANLFDDAKMKEQECQLFYSSHPSINYGLRSGDHTWPSILERIDETVCFVAFLSEAYFESHFCLAELAKFEEKNGSCKKSHVIFVLIDDDAKDTVRDCLWTVNVQFHACDEDGLAKIWQELGNRNLPLRDDVDITNLWNGIDTAFKERDRYKMGDFFDLARKHFTMPTSNNPLSFFVERDEYVQTSINMGEAAKKKLLWTVFQSPLLVAEAYHCDEYLTDYDKKFAEFKASERVRLVIFTGSNEAQAYRDEVLQWHVERLPENNIPKGFSQETLRKRKMNFERSATARNATLWFTTMKLLQKCVRPQPQKEYDDCSPLEFAYGDYGHNRKILMETGFSSPFSRTHRGEAQAEIPYYGHVTFYQEGMETGAVDRIKSEPYKPFYGHLTELSQIAKRILSDEPDPSIFFKAGNINSLCGH